MVVEYLRYRRTPTEEMIWERMFLEREVTHCTHILRPTTARPTTTTTVVL
jgi:hypothetical protein